MLCKTPKSSFVFLTLYYVNGLLFDLKICVHFLSPVIIETLISNNVLTI